MDNYIVYKKEIQEDLEIYKRVLSGELKRFPKGFWNKTYSKESASVILRYVIEDRLKLNREELLKVYDTNFIKKFKIDKMARIIFSNYIYEVLNNAYPGEFKPWELKAVRAGFWNDENIKRAVKWYIEDVHKLDINRDRNEIISIYNKKNLNDVGLSTIVYIGIYNSINMAYPNMFTEADFKTGAGLKDRTGEVFGNFKILKELGGKRVIAKCLLCGSEKEHDKSHIVKGSIKSCGCKPGKLIERTGQIFNNLKIIRELGGNRVIAKCLLCESEREYAKGDIVNGHTKSCGCKPGKFIERTGQIFNNLKIIRELGGNRVIAKCLLCGSEKEHSKGNIVSGCIKNCGCISLVKKGYKTSKIEVIDFMYIGRDGLRYYKCLNSKGEEIVLSREDIVRLG